MSETREARALKLDELASWMPEHIKRVVPLTGSWGPRLNGVLTLTDDRVGLAAAQLFVPKRLSKNRKPKAIDLAAYEVHFSANSCAR